jgi:hypothetical protein
MKYHNPFLLNVIIIIYNLQCMLVLLDIIHNTSNDQISATNKTYFSSQCKRYRRLAMPLIVFNKLRATGTNYQFLGSSFVCGVHFSSDLQRKISSIGARSHQPARSPFLHETRVQESITNSSALSNNAKTMHNAVSKIYGDCR